MARLRVPDLPDLFTYGSIRRYLPDWQNSRAEVRMASTLPWLERMAKLERYTLARFMGEGGRLTEDEVRRLATSMGLDGEVALFFRLLGRFAFSDDLDVRRRALVRAVSMLERRAELLGQGAAFRARRYGHHRAIQILSFRPDFQADPLWISARLVHPTPLAVLQQALEDLTALGGIREAFVPTRITVDASSDLADVLAVDDHLRGIAALLERDPYGPRLATAHWAVCEEVVPMVRGIVSGQGSAIAARFAEALCGHGVERLLRVQTVAGPIPRRARGMSGVEGP